MVRFALTLFIVSVCGQAAQSHFVFLLPPTDAANSDIVFSDRPEKDDQATTAKIVIPVVEVVSSSGKQTPAHVSADTYGWRVGVPSDAVDVRATLEYGVVNRGEGHVVRIRYHARMVLGEPTDGKPAAAFDVVPVKVSAGVAFRVTADRKPVAGASVTVYEPGSDQLKVLKADSDGVTPAFAKPGRYAARASLIDRTPGEADGRKFTATHSYATATVVVK